MFMMPELLPAMLSVEALEDNEVLKVEGVRLFSRICDKRQKTKVELLEEPKTVKNILRYRDTHMTIICKLKR